MKGYLGAAIGLAWGVLTVAVAVFVVLILLGWRGVDY
jgi:hypothetical protein